MDEIVSHEYNSLFSTVNVAKSILSFEDTSSVAIFLKTNKNPVLIPVTCISQMNPFLECYYQYTSASEVTCKNYTVFKWVSFII